MELEGIWHFMCWRLLPSLPEELQVNLWEHLGIIRIGIIVPPEG